jgi:putative nucleotidyltransferase with HDIG domain
MGRIVDYNLTEELAHGTYVSCLARDVAKELDLDGDVQQSIALAGLLHDIGKLTLANYLYGEEQLESPLVIEEMKYVRMHPMKSYEILKRIGYSDSICDTVRYHHENYDGSGYPDNLAGEAIPLSSRIIRVCDVFAALTSDRPYRKKFSEDEALALMIEEINHFDMRVFLAFLRVVHRVGTSYRVSFPDMDEELLSEAWLENDEDSAEE